jgi:hypothetical protein
LGNGWMKLLSFTDDKARRLLTQYLA